MRRCTTLLLFGLATLWTDPSSAQKIKIYPLTVSIHASVQPTLPQSEIEGILKVASDLLQHVGPPYDNNCKVGFRLQKLATFSDAPADITNDTQLEQVHEVPANVKVVRSISYCLGATGVGTTGMYLGCAWRPNNLQKTMIVTAEGSYGNYGVVPPEPGVGPTLWAHEFGHTTGLMHRFQSDNFNLMSPCAAAPYHQQINHEECGHFLAGPKKPPYPGLSDACPLGSQLGKYQID